MRPPCITQIPTPVPMSIINLYLPIYGTRCKPVSISVESNRFYHISMAILEEREIVIFGVHHWRHCDCKVDGEDGDGGWREGSSQPRQRVKLGMSGPCGEAEMPMFGELLCRGVFIRLS